jgi:uncharacterized protein YnzC (UPF0291/DUF896 family)
MDPIKINRINQLSKKAKADGLTQNEKEEQLQLRQEYIAEFRGSLKTTLDNIVIVDAKGNRKKIQGKKQ